jgi:hypothetical protein
LCAKVAIDKNSIEKIIIFFMILAPGFEIDVFEEGL